MNLAINPTSLPISLQVKRKTASGVVKISEASCRGFAANDPLWHRGCSDFSVGLASGKLFQGQYYDAETNLHYNRHRYYDPQTGSYLTEDPIKLAGGINNYRYVPNPIHWVDPLGLENKEDHTGGLVGITYQMEVPYQSDVDVLRQGYYDTSLSCAIPLHNQVTGTIEPLKGNPYAGMAKHIVSETTGGVFFGTTSSVTALQMTPQDSADITAFKEVSPTSYYSSMAFAPGNKVKVGAEVATKTIINVSRKFGPKAGESEPNWGKLLRKQGAGDPPAEMPNPHAHHIVFKKGRGVKMRQYLDESKDILEKHDIDWYKGSENLGWAPNKNHSTKAAKAVRDRLKKADEEIGTREGVVDALDELKKHFADDTIHTLF